MTRDILPSKDGLLLTRTVNVSSIWEKRSTNSKKKIWLQNEGLFYLFAVCAFWFVTETGKLSVFVIHTVILQITLIIRYEHHSMHNYFLFTYILNTSYFDFHFASWIYFTASNFQRGTSNAIATDCRQPFKKKYNVLRNNCFIYLIYLNTTVYYNYKCFKFLYLISTWPLYSFVK